MTAYQFRQSLFQRTVRYELAGQTLARPDCDALDFSDIKRIRIYNVRAGRGVRGSAIPAGARRCVIWPAQGRPIVISSYHFVSLGNFEDRSEEFRQFVDTLVQQVAAANPTTRFVAGMPLTLWCLWAIILAGAAVILPLAMSVFVLEMVGDGTLATIAVAAILIAAIAICLFCFLRSLGSDWPRDFDPRQVQGKIS